MNDFDEWWEKGVNNVDPKVEDDLKVQCEQLINTSTYDPEQRKKIEDDLWGYHYEELEEMKHNLLMNQIDRIDFGLNYNQTDIKNKLKQITNE